MGGYPKTGLRFGHCHDAIKIAPIELDGAAAAPADDVMTVLAVVRRPVDGLAGRPPSGADRVGVTPFFEMQLTHQLQGKQDLQRSVHCYEAQRRVMRSPQFQQLCRCGLSIRFEERRQHGATRARVGMARLGQRQQHFLWRTRAATGQKLQLTFNYHNAILTRNAEASSIEAPPKNPGLVRPGFGYAARGAHG